MHCTSLSQPLLQGLKKTCVVTATVKVSLQHLSAVRIIQSGAGVGAGVGIGVGTGVGIGVGAGAGAVPLSESLPDPLESLPDPLESTSSGTGVGIGVGTGVGIGVGTGVGIGVGAGVGYNVKSFALYVGLVMKSSYCNVSNDANT